MRNNLGWIVIIIGLLLLFIYANECSSQQLEIWSENSNYIARDGVPIPLITGAPNSNYHVFDWDLSVIPLMKSCGVNCTYINFDLGFTKTSEMNTWDKTKRYIDGPLEYDLRRTIKALSENGIISVVTLTGYGIYNYSKFWTWCAFEPHKSNPELYFDYTRQDEVKKYMRKTQNIAIEVMNEFVGWTILNPFWEFKVLYNKPATKKIVSDWYKWTTDRARTKDYADLITIEMTVTQDQLESFGADAMFEEDRNTEKVEGICRIPVSCDGYFRGHPERCPSFPTKCWNSDLEPEYSFLAQRELILEGNAGIADLWGLENDINAVERVYLRKWRDFFATVEDWSNEPSDEVCEEAIPLDPFDEWLDLPDGDKDSTNIGGGDSCDCDSLLNLQGLLFHIYYQDKIDSIKADIWQSLKKVQDKLIIEF